MISKEPILRVGVADRRREINGAFNGAFLAGGRKVEGVFRVVVEGGRLILSDDGGMTTAEGREIQCSPLPGSTFTLHDVTIGIGFHWQRNESQTFNGELHFVCRDDGTVLAINSIPLEQYLTSVITSEMSGDAPLEFLKAHAITSRSWLVAMLERENRQVGMPSARTETKDNELIRWYDREDHDLYDVCADDHCQRYQGITKMLSGRATSAVSETRGMFIVHRDSICDARFSKSCGGRTELFESAWGDNHVAYLESVSDSDVTHPPVLDEATARRWILSSPPSFCNTSDSATLKQILPSYDRETNDFFRWKVEYSQEELSDLLSTKSGFDFGTILHLQPLQRGPSGRITRLKIEGTNKTLTVGKELEIRRWLSKTHLYSSAFVVDTANDADSVPSKFILHGAGWGHGVGLCQIGAAVMAVNGKSAEEIVKHYFTDVTIKKLY